MKTFKNLFLGVFALLVSNAAGSLASRLAGGLALAATAVFNSLLDILGFDSLNSVHYFILQNNHKSDICIISYAQIDVNSY